PSRTDSANSRRKSAMVRSSSVVLPAPGELSRFNARTPRPASQPRLASPRWAFLSRTFCATGTVAPLAGASGSNTLVVGLHIAGQLQFFDPPLLPREPLQVSTTTVAAAEGPIQWHLAATGSTPRQPRRPDD